MRDDNEVNGDDEILPLHLDVKSFEFPEQICSWTRRRREDDHMTDWKKTVDRSIEEVDAKERGRVEASEQNLECREDQNEDEVKRFDWERGSIGREFV